jgi:hypothetical protein
MVSLDRKLQRADTWSRQVESYNSLILGLGRPKATARGYFIPLDAKHSAQILGLARSEGAGRGYLNLHSSSSVAYRHVERYMSQDMLPKCAEVKLLVHETSVKLPKFPFVPFLSASDLVGNVTQFLCSRIELLVTTSSDAFETRSNDL